MDTLVLRSDDDGGFQYFQDLFATCSAMMLRVSRHRQTRFYDQAKMDLEEACAFAGRVMAEN